jgi:hypothetical protein
MTLCSRSVLAFALLAGPAAAQVPPPDSSEPTTAAMPDPMLGTSEAAPPEEEGKPKQPKRGDFDAGGQARFPSGPDEMGEYASFNWVAVDVQGRYFLLDWVTLNGNAPLAVKKPDMLATGQDPRLLGGMSITLEAVGKVPDMPLLPKAKHDRKMGLALTAAYMREGAMLLSAKDFPLFTGEFQPGLAGGLIMQVGLGEAVDFSLVPTFVFQSGTTENLTALQVPMALTLKAGNAVKLSTDLGIFTGDDLSLRPSRGGRIYLGAALDVKIGRIIAHAGAGFASLLTSEVGPYPSIKDSVYVDLNARFAK